jgi:hypothetical protein
MAKLTLSDLANFQNEATAVATLAANNAATKTALENTLSRDGTSPNAMSADLDMDSNRILNLPEPVADQEPLRKIDASSATLTTLAGYATAAAAAQTAAETAQTAAELAETHAELAETNAETAETNAEAAQVAAEAAQVAAEAAATDAEASAGVIGAKWAFESSTVMAAPAVGGLRLNNATVASVTAISVNAQDAETGNPDVSNYVITWDDSTNPTKGYLVLRKMGTPATFAIFTITSVTDNTTWLELAVTHVSSAGTWTAANEMVAGFTRAGDAGLDGDIAGPGVSVDSEVVLFDGITGATVKRATQTGIAKLTSGVLGTATAGTDYYNPGGTDVAVTDGGTGSSTAAGALANLTARGQGKETISIPASSMWARTTNGPSPASRELTTGGDTMIKGWDFDATTEEGVQFYIAFPRSWNKGTVTFMAYWTNAAGLTTETVSWGMSLGAYTDDDPIDTTDLGTEVRVSDTWLAQNDLHVTAESGAVTVGNTPIDDDLCIGQIVRSVANDNMTGDATLMLVKIFFTTDAVDDA